MGEAGEAEEAAGGDVREEKAPRGSVEAGEAGNWGKERGKVSRGRERGRYWFCCLVLA